MDGTAKPCINFYQFACGKWLRNNIIPASQSELNRDHKLIEEIEQKMRTLIELPVENDETVSVERKVKIMYQKCMNEDDMEGAIIQLEEVIGKHGGWAKTGSHFIYLIPVCYICVLFVSQFLMIVLLFSFICLHMWTKFTETTKMLKKYSYHQNNGTFFQPWSLKNATYCIIYSVLKYMDVFHSFSQSTSLISLRISHLTIPRIFTFTHRDILRRLMHKKMAYLPDTKTISQYQDHMQSVNNESIHSILLLLIHRVLFI